MKVLMITGDKRFGPGNPRFELQKSAVDELAVVYWGRGAVWPNIPPEKFDVVTAQDPFWRGLFALRVAKKLGVRFNVQVHIDLRAVSWPKRLLAAVVLRRANSIRVVTECVKQQLPRALQPRAAILPVFIELAPFRAVVLIAHEQKTILWIGRFEKEKDPLAALEVLREVRATIDAKLIMLGDGSAAAQLREMAHGLPVEFPGWQNPAEYLSRADVVLCTSPAESFGAAIVEALAAGCAVVAPDVGVAKEAGANVVERKDLAKEVTRVLQAGERGELKLHLLGKEAWAQAWRQTL